jgi:glycerophosphoryl diester phosphodiesterase
MNEYIQTPHKGVALIAHRGFAGVAPENTLAAIQQATRKIDGRRAADAIEIDVLPAAGGEPVVFHDLTLGRLTDIPESLYGQPVWETPVETLQKLSVLGSPESIPTLAEVLIAIPRDVTVHIELKHPGIGQPRRELDVAERTQGRERWEGLIRRVVDLLDSDDHEVMISSSYEGALAAIRDIAPSLPCAYLFWNSIEEGLAITERYNCEAIHPAADMISATTLFNSGLTPTGPFADIDLVKYAHDTGRAVNVWTVTSWHEAAQLRAAGVDGIIADYPGLLADSDRTGRLLAAG